MYRLTIFPSPLCASPDGENSEMKEVSHLANKKIKCNLHMASLTAIKLDEGMKAYYERKVAEGKSKMSVLNAIRNKLLSRIFAVIERGAIYQKNYLVVS